MVYPAVLPLMRTPRLPLVDWTDPPPRGRFKWARPFRAKDEIWFPRVCHHISTGLCLQAYCMGTHCNTTSGGTKKLRNGTPFHFQPYFFALNYVPYPKQWTAVAQWLRCCATNRKVTGSIPASVSGFFFDIKFFRSHYDPGVDSASNRNEYQEYFLGVMAAGA